MKRMDDYKIGQETDTFPICNLNYPDYLRSDRRKCIDRQPHRLRVQLSIAQGPRQTGGHGNEREGTVCIVRDLPSKLQGRYATLQVQYVVVLKTRSSWCVTVHWGDLWTWDLIILRNLQKNTPKMPFACWIVLNITYQNSKEQVVKWIKVQDQPLDRSEQAAM